jgi:hypothetical protein
MKFILRAVLIPLLLAAAGSAQTETLRAFDNTLPLHVSTGEYQGDLWFAEGTSVDAIKKGAGAIPVQASKRLLRNRIDKSWGVLTQYFPFPSREIAYAFFIGEATLESTLNPGVETAIADWGRNPAHAYGLLQTAETAYSSKFPNWMVEDVPGFPQAPLTPRNFYDPAVSVDMGLRKACWFSKQAQADMVLKKGISASAPLSVFGKSPDFWMLVLKGFNTGWASFDVQINGQWTVNQPWYDFYGIWSPAMSAWYLKEGHLDDNLNTWHTDGRVKPYLSDPYAWITSPVGSSISLVPNEGKGRAPGGRSAMGPRWSAGARFARMAGADRFDASGRITSP